MYAIACHTLVNFPIRNASNSSLNISCSTSASDEKKKNRKNVWTPLK